MLLAGFNKKRCKDDGKPKPKFKPLKHQLFVTEYFLKSKFKGLLLYHTLGSGKSCTSIMIADNMLKKKKVKTVYVLTPGSLRDNWVQEYCQKCGGNPDDLYEHFIFITYNFDVVKNLDKVDFNDSLIIIDEVHNLINGVKNVSKNAYSIYEKIIKSNARVLLLSATVIFNNTYEWCLLMNLMKDNWCPYVIKNNKFNRNLFDFSMLTKESLTGVISFFHGFDKTEYPEVIYHKPFEIEMTPAQELIYVEKKNIEVKTVSILSDKMDSGVQLSAKEKINFILSSKKILSKSIQNFLYPKNAYEDDKKLPDISTEDGGWLSSRLFKNKFLLQLSPKFVTLIVNILRNYNSKQVVFSFYKEKAGVILLHNLLKLCGIRTKIFTGDLDDSKRSRLLKEFNSKENRYGKKIHVLLLTESGGEGITLLEVENIHLLDLSTTINKTKQAIGRSVRFRSHSELPPEKRKVDVWTYLTVLRKDFDLDTKTATTLYMRTFKNFNTFKDYDDYFIKRKLDKSKDKIMSFRDILENKDKDKEFQKLYEILQKYSIEKGNFPE